MSVHCPTCGAAVKFVSGGERPSHYELVDAAAAGAMLNVPKSWLLAEARADRVPHVRLGRYVRFEPDALRAWWRERVRGPRPT